MHRSTLAVSSILTTLWAATGCSSEAPELLYRDQPIVRAIDMHLHTGKWSLLPPRTQAYLAANFPFPLGLNPEKLANSTLSADGILSQMDTAGIERAAIFAVYAPDSVGTTTNELMISVIEEAPERFLGFASLSVANWEETETSQLAQLAAALDHPQVVGIKLSHAHQHFPLDDESYYSIYALAEEKGTPVYLHTGPSKFPGTLTHPENTSPDFLDDAISSHPGTIFILGHIGYDFINKSIGELETCLELANRYSNVYLEPSALGSSGADPTGENYRYALKRIKEEGLIDRVVYGSDGPQYPGFVNNYMERTLDAMEGADYSHEEATAVLAGNFTRLFRVAP